MIGCILERDPQSCVDQPMPLRVVDEIEVWRGYWSYPSFLYLLMMVWLPLVHIYLTDLLGLSIPQNYEESDIQYYLTALHCDYKC